jgi:SAM-dependent methyltransferase
VTPVSRYQFDHSWEEERGRLAALEEFNDPGTIGHLEALGVDEGWDCLELGAGGGSIAAWLCERVGGAGHVVATDLQTTFLEALDYPNLEVRRHDIATEELEGAFDLIHERAVLIHLPDRERVLDRLVAALKPDGWLLCENTDFSTFVDGSPYEAVRRVGSLMVGFLESASGADPNYGRRLFAALRARGLCDVGAEGRVYMIRGAHPSVDLPRLTFARVRAPLIAAGAATDEEFDEVFGLFDDPDLAVLSPVMVAAWGRRPAATAG